MALKPIVTLEPELMARCRQVGQRRVDRYALGYNAGSRNLSSHGAETNVDLQAKSMMAECALCRFLKIGLERLNWSGNSDCGFDLQLRGHKFDVKATRWNCRYLIWPINKRHIYDVEPFDILVLVKENAPDFLIAGWLTKDAFMQLHRVAPADHVLQAGTWFVHENDLFDPSMLAAWRDFRPEAFPSLIANAPIGGRPWP